MVQPADIQEQEVIAHGDDGLFLPLQPTCVELTVCSAHAEGSRVLAHPLTKDPRQISHDIQALDFRQIHRRICRVRSKVDA